MDNSINLAVLLPIIPLGMTIFILILLRSFNRTINRLTKPMSYLSLFSLCLSTLLSSYLLINNVGGDIPLSQFFSGIENVNLVIHLNKLTEKIIIALGLISSFVILYSVVKLPRQRGYVLYIVNIGMLTSFLILTSLVLDI
tara:strand:+ start:630 stop:1052 length:423 start_codon:yes stop_codon:yes gene_type:complete